MVVTLLLSVAAVASVSADDADQDRPNVIIVVIDDMPFLAEYEESLPAGVNLHNDVIEYGNYPTPNIDAFRNESVIFPVSFCGGPKCAPARFSILTGRQPTRCLYAIEKTLEEGSEIYGPDLSSNKVKLTFEDSIYNIPNVLRNNGYHTGMVGKWHLMTSDDNSYRYHCETLRDSPDAELYEKCKDILTEQGFSFVDAWYHENIAENAYFSHNPEWMVSQSQKFIERAINDSAPFFLYFASTLTHTPQVEQALTNFTFYDSPKGVLSGADVPDDTAMMSRADTWTRALKESERQGNTQNFAKYFWMDDMFGALVQFLIERDVYDNTFVAFVSDHGTEAKGTLYQQGSRILNFVRYPAEFGTDGPVVFPSDFMASAVDLAATIFDLTGVDPPAGYELDGASYLDHDSEGGDFEPPHQDPNSHDASEFDYKYVDVFRSHSIVSARWQYIFRATQEVEPSQGEGKYPFFWDAQQLYDLWTDPSQQNNLIATDFAANLEIITLFVRKMDAYIDDICNAGNDTECIKPGHEPSTTTSTTSTTTLAPVDPDCITDADCGVTRDVCVNGECYVPAREPTLCNSTDDCQNFKICNSDGECQRAHLCWTDEECLTHQTCEEGECVRIPGARIFGGAAAGAAELFQEEGTATPPGWLPLVPLDGDSLIGHLCALAFLALLMCAMFALRRCWVRKELREAHETQVLRSKRPSGYGAV